VIGKVLDTGVRTVLVPRVETAAEVRRAVRACRFSYDGGVGERGVAHARASGWGADVDPDREDGTVLVGTMLETRAAVENVEEILSVPELGFAYFGPGDLARTFGRPGEVDHPEVQDALETAREACLEAGVPAGISATDLDGAERAVEDGHRLVRVGDELSAVRQLLGDRLDALRAGDGD
jgi:2-dehydro-3-deoxyglucarate aldolase